jgi:spheroidene monooxygenase
VAALTRASIRPAKALEFWRYAPAAQRDLEASQGCRLAAGLGEAPLLRQATFTVWDSAHAMNAYARQGAHQRAIEASARGWYFSESMFARFVPTEIQGSWMGKPLG